MFFPDSLADLLKSSMGVYGVTAWNPNELQVMNGAIVFNEQGFVLVATNNIASGAALARR